MSLKDTAEKFTEDGVALMNGVIDNDIITSVRERYETLNETLTNRDIPRDRPCIVFWRHVEGEQKRIGVFDEFPELWKLINENIVPTVRGVLAECDGAKEPVELQLLETVIFDKPPETSNTLHWHQDVAYFPLKPNNQVAVWIPFEPVSRETGAMNYALGSHKEGIRGSTNLHTREPYQDEDRELIPTDPEAAGYEVVCMEMDPTDMLIHDGYTWHYTGPNLKAGHQRRGLSVRFMREEAAFDPRPGQGAAFTHQIEVNPGDIVRGLPFPAV
jgi:ectoine hydroxylase-related dioxygenase (phytanoyl-CoA dioxygenase family)